MSSNTRPAILTHDLFRGDGPHRDLADRFLDGVCVLCGGSIGREGREGDERWFCLTCWARESLRLGAA